MQVITETAHRLEIVRRWRAAPETAAMPKRDWKAMFRAWSDTILRSGDFNEVLLPGAHARHWAGFPPATDDAIAAAEARLRVRLPESYKAFLKISNGWWLEGTAGPVRLWGIEEIRPLRETQPELVEDWPQDDLVLGDIAMLPDAHLASALQISEDNDGFYLLNPRMRHGRGECQACFFATWVPGAECRVSFEDLIVERYEAFLASHPESTATSSGSPAGRRKFNLSRPPADPVSDPYVFIDRLEQLGFFEYCPPATAASIRAAYLSVADVDRALALNRHPSPGEMLFTPACGRVIDLDIGELLRGGAKYGFDMLRPMFAAAGVAVGAAEELQEDHRYAARVDGVEQEFYKLKKGRPALPGSEHAENAARYMLYGVAKLACKVLTAHGSDERVATLERMSPLCGLTGLSVVLLTDELSYEILWSGAINNFCRPMRVDVL